MLNEPRERESKRCRGLRRACFNTKRRYKAASIASKFVNLFNYFWVGFWFPPDCTIRPAHQDLRPIAINAPSKSPVMLD
jgi:hypothetical protein